MNDEQNSGRPFQAVIFDLDGVLVDSEPLHAKSWDLVLSALGLNFSQDWFFEWIGVVDRDLARHIIDNHAISVSAKELLERKRAQNSRIACFQDP